MQTFNEKGILDYTGATVSWICAIHCLAMPFIISVLPLIGLSFLADETTEWLIILGSLILALLSLVPAFLKKHGKYQTLLLFTVGFGFIGLSHLYFEDDLSWKLPFILCGAILITSAHLLNRHYCRTCKVCQLHNQKMTCD